MFKVPVLVAYPYMKASMIRALVEAKDRVNFLLDSGAFTAWKAGKPIRVEDYIAFIKGLPIKPWRYFALDVIGDPIGTRRNYETMLEAGLTPVPIFTRGEKISELDELYKTSEVVGIGGLVGTPGNRGFVKGIMRHVGSRKVHWLGFTKLDFIKHFGPYMADSSTWSTGGRFGFIELFCTDGVTRRFAKKTIHKTILTPAYSNSIRALGFDPMMFLKKENWVSTHRAIGALGLASTLKLSKFVFDHKGTNLFIAITNDVDLRRLLELQERHYK